MINNHKIICIVAVDNEWAIGKNNQLLYNVPTDMQFFRKTTSGNIVIYGLNTLNSFPKQNPLPNRTNIVLAPERIEKENLITAYNLDDLQEKIAEIDDNRDVFVCGGASVYKQMLDLCDEALITKINATTDGVDTYFPNLDVSPNWEVVETSKEIKDETSGLMIQFLTYKKK